MSVRVLVGDVRERLAEIPGESIQCCVTSPPYFGLRDYGTAGQIGLEPTLAEYVRTMVEVFREVRRVLRDDGVTWAIAPRAGAGMRRMHQAIRTAASNRATPVACRGCAQRMDSNRKI
jgi:DNA modification methylase